MFPPRDQLVRDFPHLTDADWERLFRFGALLTEWNEKLNLVSKNSLLKAYATHFADSLHILEHVGNHQGDLPTSEVGTGGGFPGLVHAILQPQASMVLYEKSPKKQIYIKEVLKAFRLGHVQVRGTLEKIPRPIFLLNRATFPPPELFEAAERFLAPGSRFNICLGSTAEWPNPPSGFRWLSQASYTLPDEQGMRKIGVIERG